MQLSQKILFSLIFFASGLAGGEKGSFCVFPSQQTPSHFYLQGEALYWRSTEDNTAFAEKSAQTVTTASDFSSQTVFEVTTREELNFEWSPGVRIYAGFQFPTRHWDLDLIWTHLITHASKFTSAPDLSVSEPKGQQGASGTILAPTWLSTEEESAETLVTLGTVNEINARLFITLNRFDAWLNQKLYSSPCFQLACLCGPNFTRITQKYVLSYIRNEDPRGALSGPGSANQTIKTAFNGGGLQGGMKGGWMLGRGVSFYSSFTAGILYGHIHVQDKEYSQTMASDTLERFYETETNKDKEWVTRPNLDLVLGVGWEYGFRGHYLFSLNVGWEYHYYFDQNFLRLATSDDPARGSLSFHGATFGAGFHF